MALKQGQAAIVACGSDETAFFIRDLVKARCLLSLENVVLWVTLDGEDDGELTNTHHLVRPAMMRFVAFGLDNDGDSCLLIDCRFQPEEMAHDRIMILYAADFMESATDFKPTMEVDRDYGTQWMLDTTDGSDIDAIKWTDIDVDLYMSDSLREVGKVVIEIDD